MGLKGVIPPTNKAHEPPPVPRSRKILCTVYAAIALAALIATWSNGGPYVHSAADFLGAFWRDAKATSASRFVAADALMLAISVVILMVIEATKHGHVPWSGVRAVACPRVALW